MDTTSYNIGIIGSGAIGSVLGTYWAKAGHKVKFSSRNPQKLMKIVEEAGDTAQLGSIEEATSFGDIILLAVNYGSVNEAIERIKELVKGKIVIDATNPLIKTGKGYQNLVPKDKTAGEVMQNLLPEAKIMKSYTTLWSKYLETESNKKEGLLVMPLSGGSEADKVIVSQLISDSGFHPYDLGDLSQSKPQDPGSNIWNKPLNIKQFEQAIQTH